MGRRGVGLAAACLLIALAIPSVAGAATFNSPTPISDPSGSGPASPYPSIISVSGLPGTVDKARVTLNNIFGGPAQDLDVLLVGPGGSSILMSDICSLGGTQPDLIHLTYTFDDTAPSQLPETCSGAPLGTAYKPTDYQADSFPGVPPPYPVGLSAFHGTAPNGDWRLFVFDDSYPDAWSIQEGWNLDLTTVVTPAKKKCKKKHKRRAAEAKKKRCKKKKRR
jgi:hypothetical protein